VDGGLTVTPAHTSVQVGRDGSATVPLQLTAPASAVIPSSATLTVTAAGQSVAVPVEIAAASRLGTASASSTTSGYPAASVNDGDTSSDRWGQGEGWNDGTINAFPDSVQVAFAAPAPIGRVDVDTLDSTQYPAAQYGLRDARVALLVDGTWRDVGSIENNTAGHVSLTFAPAQASAVRLTISASNSGEYSRVIELTALPK
jgi:hypothetical protein